MSVQRFDICIDYDQNNPIEITEMGEWIKYDDYKKIEQQNKQMIESLRYYLIYNLSSGGLVFTKIKNCYESVTGKKIEEIIT